MYQVFIIRAICQHNTLFETLYARKLHGLNFMVNNPSESHMTPVHMTKQTENKLTRLFYRVRTNDPESLFLPFALFFPLTDQREYEKRSMFTGTRSAALHHTGVPTARALRITRVTAPLLDDVIAAHFNPVRTSSCVFIVRTYHSHMLHC